MRERFRIRKNFRWRESAGILLKGGAVILFASLFFYRSLLAAVFLLPLLYPLSRREMHARSEKRKKELTFQFRDLCESVVTALKAGYSADNAFREAYRDMAFLYGEKSDICRHLLEIDGGLQNNVPLEELLYDFGEESEVEEIREFAEVFSIARHTGGDLVRIMERTNALIQNRLEVEAEIDRLLQSRRFEQRIMDVVPFAIALYVQATSQGFFDALYHNPAGILVMTGCLGAYLAAFSLSEKIVEIRV